MKMQQGSTVSPNTFASVRFDGRIRFISRFIKQSIRFVGWKVIRILALAGFSGFALSLVELAFLTCLQYLLITLGLMPRDATVGPAFLREPTAFSVGCVMILLGAIRFFLQVIVGYSAIYSNELVSIKLKLTALRDLTHLESARQILPSHYNHLFNEVFNKSSQFINSFAGMIPALLQVVTFIAMMLYYSVWNSMLALAGTVAIGLISAYWSKKVHRLSNKIPFLHRELSKALERIYRNWLLILLQKTGKREYAATRDIVVDYSSTTLKNYRFLFAASSLPSFLGIFLLVFIIWLNAKFSLSDGAQFLAFLFLFIRMVQNLAGLTNNVNQSISYFPQFKEALAFYNASERDAGGSIQKDYLALGTKKLEKRSFEGKEKYSRKAPPRIEILNVSFRYQVEAKEVLSNFNYTFYPGKHIAICGESGSGKSTLLSLILGLVSPNHGKILVDGKEITSNETWNSYRISYVGPDPYIIHGSIYENMIYGVDTAVELGEVVAILEQLGLSEILNMPGGLDYIIAEDGSGLSTGQKQRLCFARAILRKPDLMILDEATANVDSYNESLMVNFLAGLKGTTTVIAVTHKEGMLREMDSVIRMPS